ncbi:MAG: hypothetical protein WCH39_19585, partial [Schlesneria sp.]
QNSLAKCYRGSIVISAMAGKPSRYRGYPRKFGVIRDQSRIIISSAQNTESQLRSFRLNVDIERNLYAQSRSE